MECGKLGPYPQVCSRVTRPKPAGISLSCVTSLNLRYCSVDAIHHDVQYDGGGLTVPRRIKAKKVVADIRARLSDFELMDKYDLSPDELQRVLRCLTEAGVIRNAELDERGAWFDDPANRCVTRGVPRHYLRVAPSIHDSKNPAHKGYVTDLSEDGFRVRGINARIGEEKTLVIHASALCDVEDVEVTATCRWLKPDFSEKGLHESGYHIEQTTETGLAGIRRLIEVLSLGDRNLRSPRLNPTSPDEE